MYLNLRHDIYIYIYIRDGRSVAHGLRAPRVGTVFDLARVTVKNLKITRGNLEKTLSSIRTICNQHDNNNIMYHNGFYIHDKLHACTIILVV